MRSKRCTKPAGSRRTEFAVVANRAGTRLPGFLKLYGVPYIEITTCALFCNSGSTRFGLLLCFSQFTPVQWWCWHSAEPVQNIAPALLEVQKRGKHCSALAYTASQ